MIKNILKSVVLLFIIIKPLYIHAEWKSIHHDRLFSISGVVSFTDGFLVVHDNKSKGQPRISFINKENTIRPLVWPSDTPPFDLEAIHIIPGASNEFLVMESGGVCYRVMVKPESKEVSIINKFILPKVSKIMNLEGMTLFKSNKYFKIAYGDRGSDDRRSTLFIGDYEPSNNSITNINSYVIDLPEPESFKRNIADLVFDPGGVLWSAATSDPGDDGPFETRIYKIGQISRSGVFSKFQSPKAIKGFSDQKVEAMTNFSSGLILMTDNENFGSSSYYLNTSK